MGWMEWINSHGPTIGFIFGVLVLTACLIKAILWLKGGGTYRETPKNTIELRPKAPVVIYVSQTAPSTAQKFRLR